MENLRVENHVRTAIAVPTIHAPDGDAASVPEPIARGEASEGQPAPTLPARRPWRWIFGGGAAAGIAGLVAMCAVAQPTPPTADEVPSCDLPRRPLRAELLECPRPGCGGNGTYLSGFLFEGLNLDGCRNQDGVRVVPGSLRRGTGACPDGALRLDLAGGALIGRRILTGSVACEGAKLDGATFTVEGPARALGLEGDGERNRELRIRVAGSVATVPTDRAPSAKLSAYAFEPAEGGASLCHDAPGPWLPEVVSIDPAGSASTPALLVSGELYDPHDASVLFSGPAAARWVNVACRGGALSKLRLIGLDPAGSTSAPSTSAPSTSTPDERQATLKMITAKYCDATSYTVDGVHLHWRSLTGAGGTGPVSGAGPVEARWGRGGATCLSHSRVWQEGRALPPTLGKVPVTTEADFVSRVQQQCGIPACGAPGGPGGREYWITHTVDHVSHPAPRGYGPPP